MLAEAIPAWNEWDYECEELRPQEESVECFDENDLSRKTSALVPSNHSYTFTASSAPSHEDLFVVLIHYLYFILAHAGSRRKTGGPTRAG